MLHPSTKPRSYCLLRLLTPGHVFPPGQKRRSNRQVKRKKYTEDLDIKITDDEDDEDVDVTTTAAAVASISGGPQLMGAQLKQELELDGDGLASMQFFVVGGQTHLKCVHLYRKHFVYGYNDVAM